MVCGVGMNTVAFRGFKICGNLCGGPCLSCDIFLMEPRSTRSRHRFTTVHYLIFYSHQLRSVEECTIFYTLINSIAGQTVMLTTSTCNLCIVISTYFYCHFNLVFPHICGRCYMPSIFLKAPFEYITYFLSNTAWVLCKLQMILHNTIP